MTMRDYAKTRAVVRALRSKQRVVYYEGDLAVDREKDKGLAALAEELYNAQLAGLICLTQRRLGPGRFAYIATGRG